MKQTSVAATANFKANKDDISAEKAAKHGAPDCKKLVASTT